MKRRQALLGTTAVLSGITGCLGLSSSDGTLREVYVELRNTSEQTQTFHLAPETEAGVLDWQSHHIDAGVNEEVTIPVDGDVSLVALHGAVDDFAGSVDNLDVDGPDGEYCLRFQFDYIHPPNDNPQIAHVADTECYL